ncbi:MAG: T9SS type A sorting domain-containing protein [Bacteroidota bacterium]
MRNPEPDGFYILEDFTTGVAASDNCSAAVTISQNPATGTPLSVGVYDITLTATDDLGNPTDNAFELTVAPVLGVEENNLNSLTFYLNPASNQVTLANPNNISLKEITIYDLSGRLVTTVNMTNMGTEKTIDISSLQSATYMVIITGENGRSVKQLIVDK